MKKKSSLKHTLEDLFGRAVSFETRGIGQQQQQRSQHRCTLRVSRKLAGSELPKNLSPSSAVPLMQIMEALDVMGLLLPKLEWLAKNLEEQFILPLLTNPSLSVTFADTGIISEATCAPVSALQQDSPAAASIISSIISGTVFGKLEDILKFVVLRILHSSSEKLRPEEEDGTGSYFTRLLGNAWWKGLSALVIKEALERSLPSDYNHLEKYSSFAVIVVKFEDNLISLGLVPSGERDLKKFVENVDIHYSEKKRRDLLVMAREVLMRDDHNTVEVTDTTERGGFNLGTEDKAALAPKKDKEGLEVNDGDDGLITLPTCHVSIRTQTLVELIYQTLNEASPSQPHL